MERSEGGSVNATWSSVVGRIYTLQTSPDLTEGNWTTVPAGDRITAVGPTTMIPDTGGVGEEQRYYRVLVE